MTDIDAGVIPPPPGTPEPITPATKGSAKNDRILYENFVNEGAARFALEAHAAYIDATLQGGTVELVTSLPDEAEDTHGIADATAAAFAADEGLVPYEDWSADELADECRNRGLKVSGKKDELIERLIANDTADVDAIEE